jgi:predicted glycosyltransferase
MKVLIDIVHPADVLFFLNPIRRLQALGHKVTTAARDKDCTLELLSNFDLPWQSLSRAGRGLLGLGLELAHRDAALWRLVRRTQPDIMCGFGGVAIAHVGRLLGIPAISFYDTERAQLQNRLSLPFLSHLYAPESYRGPEAKGRTTRFPGTKELSYFHPQNFRPDRKTAIDAGLDPERRNVFVRLVNWASSHDLGRHGWPAESLRALIGSLSGTARVHLSSERSLPDEFSPHMYRGPAHAVHHLLAHSDVYIGESATMSVEAALLGVPAIYAADDWRGYVDELAHQSLIKTVADVTPGSLQHAVQIMFAWDREAQARRLATWLRGKPNLAQYVVEAILQHARHR